MSLTTGTKAPIIPKFSVPLVDVTPRTLVASTAAVPTLDFNDLHSYFPMSSRFQFILTTRPPWSTSVLNRNTLPT
ncbi:hypothetical protein A2U01_0087618, partial [Trifolium medium]|nr:hypothetical protein [Trifolium medium]